MKKMKLLLASVLLAMNATAAVTFESLGEVSNSALNEKLGMFVNESILYYDYYTDDESYFILDIYSLNDMSFKKQIKLATIGEVGEEKFEYNYPWLDISFADYKSAAQVYDTGARLTQTLFNDDDKYEIVREVYAVETFADGAKLLRTEIINEDGEVLCVLPEGSETSNAYGNASYYVIGLKDGYALASEIYVGSYDGDGVLISYKINKGASGLTLTKLSTTKAYPNPVNSSNSFTIEVDETKLGTTNYVEVVDESGRMVYRSELKGAKAIVPARRMRGMNVYRIVSDGEVVDTGKMLVK